jgi:hypothetical protein
MRITLILSALAILMLAPPASAHSGGGGGLSVDLPDHGLPAACSELRFRTRRGEIATGEERISIAPPATGAIRIDAGGRGGVHARGEARSDLELLVCKAATGATVEEARTRLARVKVVVDGATASLEGPSDDGWAAHAFVRAPQAGELALTVKNGPLAVEGIAGRLAIHAANGPVDLERLGGEATIEASNGPVSLADSSGSITLRAQNGPVGIELAGRAWEGAGLTVESTNGPLALELDPAYASGVRVEVRHGPFACGLSPCGRTVRDGGPGDGRTVELGSGPAKVTVAATNGPVSIDAR